MASVLIDGLNKPSGISEVIMLAIITQQRSSHNVVKHQWLS